MTITMCRRQFGYPRPLHQENDGLEGNKIEREQILFDHNTVVIRPVYKARTAFVKINFDETKGGMAQNSFENGEVLKVGMLDTIAYDAYGKPGNSVFGYAGWDANIDSADMTSDADERELDTWTLENRASELTIAFQTSTYPSVTPVSQMEVNAAVPNELNFTPQKSFTQLTVQYSQPSMTVKIDPKSAEADGDKGSVFYLDTESYTEEEGNKDKDMVLTGIKGTRPTPKRGAGRRLPDSLEGLDGRHGWGQGHQRRGKRPVGRLQEAVRPHRGLRQLLQLSGQSDHPLIYYRFVPKQ